MLGCECIDEVGLDLVGILIFVDQDELKLSSIKQGDVLVFDQHPECLFEQIVEIDRVRRLLLSFITRLHILDLLEQRQEIGELFGKQFLHGPLGVDSEAE